MEGGRLEFRAALGDVDAVRAGLGETGDDLATVIDAFLSACRFGHEAVASILLERSISLDTELGRHIDGNMDRLSFIRIFNRSDRPDFAQVAALGLWKVFVMGQVQRALRESDLTAFVGQLHREPWPLGDSHVPFQAELIETARFQKERGAFIGGLEPASILHQLVTLPDPYESMRYLIDRGIDMTIKDYRWDSNAAGWARYGYNDETLAQWLEDEERRRQGQLP